VGELILGNLIISFKINDLKESYKVENVEDSYFRIILRFMRLY
jgi:hypothetical protein